MKLTVLAVSLALACAFTSAEARPISHLSVKHLDRHIGGQAPGCSDPVMKPCETGGAASRGRGGVVGARHERQASAALARHGREGRAARPRAWCGWWLGRHLGMLDRKLWLARNWAHVGRPAHGPHIGAVVVWARGRRSGHVGIITGKTERGWVVKSGNDGHAVRERVRSVSNAIAFRWPS